jgi:hypothetical protein
MAKVYLSTTSPDFTIRTWADVMEMYAKSGMKATRDRKERAFRSRPLPLPILAVIVLLRGALELSLTRFVLLLSLPPLLGLFDRISWRFIAPPLRGTKTMSDCGHVTT